MKGELICLHFYSSEKALGRAAEASWPMAEKGRNGEAWGEGEPQAWPSPLMPSTLVTLFLLAAAWSSWPSRPEGYPGAQEASWGQVGSG